MNDFILRNVVSLCLCWSACLNKAASPSLRGGSKIHVLSPGDLTGGSRVFKNDIDLLIIGNESSTMLMQWAEKLNVALIIKWQDAGIPAPGVSTLLLQSSERPPNIADESADDGHVQWETLKMPNVALVLYGSVKRWFRIEEGSGCGGELDNPPFIPELVVPWVARRSVMAHLKDVDDLKVFQSVNEISVISFGLDGGTNAVTRDAFAGVMRNVHDRAVSLISFARAEIELLPLFDDSSQYEHGFAIMLSNNRLYPPQKHKFADYDSDNVYLALLNWVQDNSYPPVLPARRCTEAKWNKGNLIEDGGATDGDATKASQQLVAFVFPHRDSPWSRSLPGFTEVERLASNLLSSGRLVVVVDKEDHKSASNLYESFGLDNMDLPCVRLELQRFAQNGEYGRKPSNLRFRCDFGLPANSTAETIETCMRAYDSGGLQPYFKSEPAPDYISGPVQDIVGSTFDGTVLTPGRDFVMLFCTPWCGHCKKFEPTFRELASRMQDIRPWVAFGKMDFTRNDNRVFDFWTSPQLHIFQAYYKDDPVYYDIHRDQSEKPIEAWVLSHTKRKPPRTWHAEPKNQSEEDGLLSDDVQVGTPGEL